MRSWELKVTSKGESVVCVPILATVRRKLFYFAGTYLNHPNFFISYYFRIRTKHCARM